MDNLITSGTSTTTYSTVPSTTPYLTVPSTTPYSTVPSTTTYLTVPSTTPYSTVPSTTTYLTVPSTTPYSTVPSTTPYSTVPSTTTSGATTTTSGQSTGKSISSLVEDLMGMFPNITPEQLTQLMNSGIDISKLMPSINNNGTVLSDKGINSQYRGPSTNILQKNYKGATNVYSPFLYYNKGTSEKFSSIKANDLKNISNSYLSL